MRYITCKKCGGTSTQRLDGSKCGGLTGIVYKVCNSCGYAEPTKEKPKK